MGATEVVGGAEEVLEGMKGGNLSRITVMSHVEGESPRGGKNTSVGEKGSTNRIMATCKKIHGIVGAGTPTLSTESVEQGPTGRNTLGTRVRKSIESTEMTTRSTHLVKITTENPRGPPSIESVKETTPTTRGESMMKSSGRMTTVSVPHIGTTTIGRSRLG